MLSTLNILLIDEGDFAQPLAMTLESLGHRASTVRDKMSALDVFRMNSFDLIFFSFKSNGAEEASFIAELKALRKETMIVALIDSGRVESPAEVIKDSIFECIIKPFQFEDLKRLLQKVSQVVILRKENQILRNDGSHINYFNGFTSNAMKHLREFIKKISPTDATVLLTGESGTGKSHLAKQIHYLSECAKGPFVEVHCTTLTESIIESELFGYKKGSFTGAHKDTVGKIQAAEGGTIFLDEIGDLSLSSQAKLLRFLQEKTIEAVGSNHPIEVHARVIAATNKNLEDMVEKGTFREDLYYRLNIFECKTPCLRYRKEDLEVFLWQFIRECSVKNRFREKIVVPPALLQSCRRHFYSFLKCMIGREMCESLRMQQRECVFCLRTAFSKKVIYQKEYLRLLKIKKLVTSLPLLVLNL